MGTEMYCFRSTRTAGSPARAWIWARSASRCTQSTTSPACSSYGRRRARWSATGSDRGAPRGREISAESDLVRGRSGASWDCVWITGKPEVMPTGLRIGTEKRPCIGWSGQLSGGRPTGSNPFHPSDGPPTAILQLYWASPAPHNTHGLSGRSRTAKIAKDLPLQVLEEVGDFLAGFFGVVDGDVLALFGAEGGIAANGLAGVHGGMLGNFEGFLGAIRGFHGDDLRAFADIFHGALGGVHRLIADPHDRMRGLLGAFASRVDDDMAAFLAGEVGSLGGILEAVNGGFLGELDRFDGAVGGLHSNRFCSGIDFFDGTGDDVGGILCACHGNCEAGREKQEDCLERRLKKTGSHRFSLEDGRAGNLGF